MFCIDQEITFTTHCDAPGIYYSTLNHLHIFLHVLHGCLKDCYGDRMKFRLPQVLVCCFNNVSTLQLFFYHHHHQFTITCPVSALITCLSDTITFHPALGYSYFTSHIWSTVCPEFFNISPFLSVHTLAFFLPLLLLVLVIS